MATCTQNASHLCGMGACEAFEAFEHHTSTKAEHCEEYPKDEKSWFGYEDETPILSSSTPPCAVFSECGLLVDLSESPAVPIAPVKFAQPLADPLLALIEDNWAASTAAAGPSDAADVIGDLLGEWPSSNSLSNVNASPSIRCSTSASNIQKSSAALDPFAELLSQSVNSTGKKQASAASSSSTTSVPSRAKCSRIAMEHWNRSTTAWKPKITGDVFGDLLSSHGFTKSSKNAARTLGDLKRAEEIKEMDSVAVTIRDWIDGKERNIRALLSSLNEVLWEGAESWEQPRMSDLLTAAQVKRNYHKACLVVHPDRQVGKPHEKLAVAIFTELNSAWNIFEEAGNRSLQIGIFRASKAANTMEGGVPSMTSLGVIG